jgi:acyl-CoA thioester hydrolase
LKDIVPKNTVSHQVNRVVQKHEIDGLDHVNNVVYLQWVNDISEKHWSILSNMEIDNKYFWVAIRHEIDYINQAVLGDEITIYTWIGETGGVRSVRNVHIYKKDTLLAKAKTTWCLVDKKTTKPTRIKQDILNILEEKS